MSYLQLSTLGLGNLSQYPTMKVYTVLGAWVVALAFAIVAIAESNTTIDAADADDTAIIESRTKKQYRCNIFTALALFAFVATFYFSLQLL